MKRNTLWSWLWIVLGVLYFFVPLYATFDFSLRAKRGVLSFAAYDNVFHDPKFFTSFGFSVEMAILTIIVSLVIIVPTAYWVHLKLPSFKPVLDFITLVPFVIPAIVLVYGLIKTYSSEPLSFANSPALLVAAYVVLSFPYVYRAVDTGLRAMDVRTLTEAAQSLGAGWPTIILQVIFPNLRVALLSGAFLTFAIVIGEFTMATMLNWPAFGPYMVLLGLNRAYEPAAVAIISFGLTWASLGMMQLLGRGTGGQAQVAGAR